MIDSWLDWHVRVLRPALIDAVMTRVWPEVFAHGGFDGSVGGDDGADDEVKKERLERGRRDLRSCLEFIESQLARVSSSSSSSASQQFLCGSSISIADYLIATALVVWLALPVCDQPVMESHPALSRWLQGMQSLPAWKQVHAPFDAFCVRRQRELELSKE